MERQRVALLSEAGETLGHRLEPEHLADPSDQAAVERDREYLLRIRERAKQKLRQIDHALSRMRAERYGFCAGCGDEIPCERLQAKPDAAHCLRCQSRLEDGDSTGPISRNQKAAP